MASSMAVSLDDAYSWLVSDGYILRITLLVFASLFLQLLYKILYNLYFHPLARFPGPKLAAASKWNEFYYDIIKGQGGQFAWEIDRMHDVYGPIVRVNPDELHIRDPTFYDTLYTVTGGKRNKYPPAAEMTGSPLSVFGTLYHDIHRRRKAPLAQYFSRKSIDGGQALVAEQVELLSAQFEKFVDQGSLIDIRIDLLAFTTDTFTRYAFGETFGILGHPVKAENWFKTMAAVAELTSLIKQFPWIIGFIKAYVPMPFVKFVAPNLSRVLVMQEDCNDRAAEFLCRKQQQIEKNAPEPARPDMFDAVWNSPLPPEEKTTKRLGQEGFATLAAGGETTARTMSRGLYYITSNPAILKRLRAEIEAVMPDRGILPPLSVLEAQPYLKACVRESLRKTGLVASRLPLILPDKSLPYKDWLIPAGTPVGMTIYKTMHDAERYGDPEAFRPERWIATDDNDPTGIEQALVAFGRGSRMCLGQHFAYAEMYLGLAALVRRFDFELVDVDFKRDIEIQRDCFLAEPSKDNRGINARITRRD